MRMIFAVFVIAILTGVQPLAGQTKSPKEVVEDFWKMDTKGGRLTDEGWRAADRFFVRPIVPPDEKIVCVLGHGFGVSLHRMEGNKADVIVETPGRVWKLDSRMRLGVCGSDQGKEFWVHKLVLTGEHWESATDHRTLHQVSGTTEWRLEKENNYVYLDLETAIRYLTHIRDSANDSAIRSNAAVSLATLGKAVAHPRN